MCFYTLYCIYLLFLIMSPQTMLNFSMYKLILYINIFIHFQSYLFRYIYPIVQWTSIKYEYVSCHPYLFPNVSQMVFNIPLLRMMFLLIFYILCEIIKKSPILLCGSNNYLFIMILYWFLLGVVKERLTLLLCLYSHLFIFCIPR